MGTDFESCGKPLHITQEMGSIVNVNLVVNHWTHNPSGEHQTTNSSSINKTISLMVPWIKLGRAFAGHSFVNGVKTLLGVAMVGWGMSILHPERTLRDDPNDDDADDHKDHPKMPSSRLSSMSHTERYVTGFVLIGMGFLVSLPSIMSQIVWEAAIPALHAAEIVGNDVTSDLFTLGLTDYFKSLKSSVSDWKKPIGGGSNGRGGDLSRSIAGKLVPSSNEINTR